MAHALAVVPGESSPRRQQRRSVRGRVEKAALKSRRDLLLAMREHIAQEIDKGVPPRDLASLSRRLLEIAREIEALDGDGSDDVGRAAATPDDSWSG